MGVKPTEENVLRGVPTKFSAIPSIAGPIDSQPDHVLDAHMSPPELPLVDALEAAPLRHPHDVEVGVPVSRRLHVHEDC